MTNARRRVFCAYRNRALCIWTVWISGAGRKKTIYLGLVVRNVRTAIEATPLIRKRLTRMLLIRTGK
jgi:hypothetical protein